MGLYLTCDCKPRYIKNFDGPPRCSVCGIEASMDKPAKIYRQLDVDYQCPITDAPIRSKHAHEENLKKHGCRLLEPGEDKDVERFRKEQDRIAEEAIASTAEAIYHSLPEPTKQRLAEEVLSTEIEFSRQTK